MKKLLMASVFAMLVTGAAQAQLALHTSTNDPLTGLPPAEWEQMVSHILDASGVRHEPGVIVVSSLSEPITVTCDKWQLVGPDVYKSVRGNPTEIKPFSITYMKTQEFDGYCKAGVVAHGTMGKTMTGHLDAANGSFSDSTVVLFSGARR